MQNVFVASSKLEMNSPTSYKKIHVTEFTTMNKSCQAQSYETQITRYLSNCYYIHVSCQKLLTTQFYSVVISMNSIFNMASIIFNT